ncbi:hypothetical protein WA588_004542, partial [Blastocystis sp. NMH]
SSSESLQTSVVLKELKRNLSEKYQVSKEAREAIQLSATIFIHYITSAAIELVQSQKKSTIQPQHILKSLEENGFEDMIPEVEAYLQTLEEGAVENPPSVVPTNE